jgi:hypothetical protein
MRLDSNARVLWLNTPNMPARFGDLFANDCEIVSVPDVATTYCSWRLAILPEDEAKLPKGFARVGAGAHPIIRGLGKIWWSARGQRDDSYRYMLFPKQHSRRSTRRDARHLDLEYGRIPESMRDAYRPVFSRISVKEEILRRVEQWSQLNLVSPVVGVQVRTWRDDPRRYSKYHKPAVRRLAKLVTELPEDTRVFVVSDSDDVTPWLTTLIGVERVLEYSRSTSRSSSWHSSEGVVEDLIDMLLLARVPELFASYLSTFSETAWWLGGARANVRVF